MKKKQLPSLLYLTLLAAVTAGCSMQKTDQPKTEPQTTAEPPAAKAEIPLPEMDFGAAEYRILTAAEQWQSDYNAENTGDIIDDIIFARNKNVEERYNIKLEYQIKNGWNAGVEEVRTALTGSVMGGTAEYDLMVGSVSYVSPRAVENLFRNLYDCDELDLSQPWWYPSINKEMEICGKLFLGAGSFGIATMDSAVMTYFNKQLVEDFHLDNPYQIVAEGKWTVDKLMEMSATVLGDLNSDGVYDRSDRVGILSSEDYLAFMVNSMGHLYIQHKEDGTLVIDDPNDRFYRICDKYSNLLKSKAYLNVYPTFLDGTQDANVMYRNMLNMFASNQALFIYHKLYHVKSSVLRNMEPYGLLPSPKYDEAQENYITPVINDVAAIPGVVKDTVLSGTILEALQYYTYQDVRPVYYDVALTRKGTRDADSEKMLDLIFQNPVCDFSYMFMDDIGNLFYGINSSAASYASFAQSKYKQFRKKLDTIVKEAAEFQD